MSLLLELPRETEEALRRLAEKDGLALDTFALNVLSRVARNRQETFDADYDPGDLTEAVRKIRTRTPAEFERNRAEAFAKSRPALSLPQGKTLTEMLVGKWPGAETDEEIAQILEAIS
ncbi:hypothetical protein [Armatimonas sp.]|uniref:hypothetical protein n=1 Tax=Armatimonas sp. TaxID=1872638 RepID=UPI00375029CB